jgi:hypothetical protein
MANKRKFVSRLLSRLGTRRNIQSPTPARRLRLSGKAIRVPVAGAPVFEVEMGRQRLQIHPDLAVDQSLRRSVPDYLLYDPDRYITGIAHFLRLRPGETLGIDRNAGLQEPVFSAPREAFRRHLSVGHEGDCLTFRDTISELGTYVRLLGDVTEIGHVAARRRSALLQVLDIFGGPIEALPPGDALTTITAVNQLLREEVYRPRDAEGNPGGIVEPPAELTPVLVGDLHANIDNLLKILSENAFMQALTAGEAVLIFLGDAVHRESKGELEEMDTSVLMMDLILKLKLRFPHQVFFLVGNHDSFSPDVMKGGVPQSALWERRLGELRGEAYVKQMALFYQHSPVVAMSRGYLACHAGPCRARISREVLVNIRQFPALLHELTWTRLKTPRFPAGYTRGDVRRFRKSLELDREAAFIVGHYPFGPQDTLWLDVGHIENHHILYSARPDQVGVFTRIDGRMVPQVYPAEPLVGWVNRQAGARAAAS